MKEILVIGAGAAGIMAALAAAEAGARVHLFEKNDIVGKKLGITIKVETNGSGGAKNVLTKEEIAACDGIIVAAKELLK